MATVIHRQIFPSPHLVRIRPSWWVFAVLPPKKKNGLWIAPGERWWWHGMERALPEVDGGGEEAMTMWTEWWGGGEHGRRTSCNTINTLSQGEEFEGKKDTQKMCRYISSQHRHMMIIIFGDHLICVNIPTVFTDMLWAYGLMKIRASLTRGSDCGWAWRGIWKVGRWLLLPQ